MSSDLSHLGGHLGITHVDIGAIYWLKSMGACFLLDIGCSVGGQVLAANEAGMNAYGIEGDYSLLHSGSTLIPSRILFSDLTKTYVELPILFDCVWCVEVAEHIEEKYTPNLVKTITSNLKEGGILVFTANEGPGIHHVHLKPEKWWIEELKKWDLVYDKDLTNGLKTHSTMNREFIKNTGMVFIKKEGVYE